MWVSRRHLASENGIEATKHIELSSSLRGRVAKQKHFNLHSVSFPRVSYDSSPFPNGNSTSANLPIFHMVTLATSSTRRQTVIVVIKGHRPAIRTYAQTGALTWLFANVVEHRESTPFELLLNRNHGQLDSNLRSQDAPTGIAAV